jgi:hypothetical protein
MTHDTFSEKGMAATIFGAVKKLQRKNEMPWFQGDFERSNGTETDDPSYPERFQGPDIGPVGDFRWKK